MMSEPEKDDLALALSEAVDDPSRSWRPTIRRALLGMASGTLVALLVPLLWLYPYLEDDRTLDVVVRVAALDWRDFGERRAQSRLQYELDHAGIGPWVGDGDCSLLSEPPSRVVRCGWGVELEVPGMDLVLPLSFSSMALIDEQGELD